MDYKKMKKNELVEYIKQTHQTLKDSKQLIDDIQKKSETIKSCYDNSTSWSNEIDVLKKSIEDSEKGINSTKDTIKAHQLAITDLYDELFQESGRSDGETTSKKQKIEEFVNTLTTQIDAQSKHIVNENELNSNRFEQQFTTLKDTQEKTFKHIEENREELFNRINGLLPEATSAGLASSYKAAQDEIEYIPLLWFAFIGIAIGLFFWFAYPFYMEEGVSVKSVFFNLLTGSPLIWLIWYIQRSISQKSQLR